MFAHLIKVCHGFLFGEDSTFIILKAILYGFIVLDYIIASWL